MPGDQISDWTFFDSNNLTTFWNDFHVIIKTAAPGLMISAAAYLMGLLIVQIRNGIWPRDNEEDDEEEDY